MVDPAVKANMVASTTDLKGASVCFIRKLIILIIKIIDIKVAGAITQGISLINIRMDLIFSIALFSILKFILIVL